MLHSIDNPAIMAQLADYSIPNGALLHTKTLYHRQRATVTAPGRILLFISRLNWTSPSCRSSGIKMKHGAVGCQKPIVNAFAA